MKAKEFIIELKKESKPRNFVAKNAKMGGAGQHKDKKLARKQGDVKHKNKEYAESLDEVSWKGIKQGAAAAGLAGAMAFGAGSANARVTPGDDPSINRLTGKPIAAQQATDNAPAKAQAPKGFSKEYLQAVVDGKHPRPMVSVEKAQELLKNMSESIAEGTGNDFRVGQRVIYTTGRGEKFPSIITAIDFDEDAVKIKSANNKPFPNSGGDIEIVVDPGWKFLTPEPRVDPDSVIAVSPSMRKTTERVRDPEDWDEGNTEPPNNFAVYVNGKKIAVFQGRGRYADDQREQAHHEQLKGWARKKSAETGKKWEVSITGEPATR
jgi:hypothetical protein